MLIIFDLDGTIIESGKGIVKSFEYSLTKMGLEVPNV
ncbi:HAD hydrolase-like protein [Peptoniphilus indolicus]|nr:HAD hydrolase-like protein [Peptoniphilus indolicus]